jgi:hypothetical protein
MKRFVTDACWDDFRYSRGVRSLDLAPFYIPYNADTHDNAHFYVSW